VVIYPIDKGEDIVPAIDLKQSLKALYSASPQPQLVDVPPRKYLMIDGTGDPNTSDAFMAAVPSLYTLAYSLRAALKAAEGVAYKVMPLEGLWWVSDLKDFDYGDKSNWQWTLMISLPENTTSEMFDAARQTAKRKKPDLPLNSVRLETLNEGLSAQILHVGPFANEPATIERLDAFIQGQGYSYAGKHHEIYLSDFQRAAPEKLKTIIRYPVARR
jgi:hypothetical protein